MSNKWN